MIYLSWIVPLAAVIVLVWIVAVYNRFVRLIQRAKEAWADMKLVSTTPIHPSSNTIVHTALSSTS